MSISMPPTTVVERLMVIRWHSPGRPGLRPHIRLLRGSRPPWPLLPFSFPGGTLCPPSGQDLLLSRTVIGRREVALRGPFRLRLASACPLEPSAFGGASPAQPRTRASAMDERYFA